MKKNLRAFNLSDKGYRGLYGRHDDDWDDEVEFHSSSEDRRVLTVKLGDYLRKAATPTIKQASKQRKGDEKPMTRDLRTENQQLRDALTKSRDQIREMEAFIQTLEQGPNLHAYVIKTDGKKVVLSTSQGIVEVPGNPEVGRVLAGECVLFSPGGGFIAGRGQETLTGGVYIAGAVDPRGKWLEIDADGSPRRIIMPESIKAETGDRVLVDPGMVVVLDNLGKDQQRFSFDGDTGVSWSDIGGLDAAKDALREAIELPAVHADLFKAYGKHISKGVLLYGPAGCGKTLLAKAAATSLATTFGAEAKSTGFIYVKGPELLDKWVGNTESMIRGLFARARDHKKSHGYPAILFIDEADALLYTRGGGRSLGGLSQTIVPQFLSEMDGLDDSGAFVLLATNRPDILDPAVVRDGRIDRKVNVTRPNRVAATEILRIHMRGRPLDQKTVEEFATHAADGLWDTGIDKTQLATMGLAARAAETLYSDEFAIYDVTYNNGNGRSVTRMKLADLVNGAMLAGIVESASGNALLRDIAGGGNRASGLSLADIERAIKNTFRENLDTNHDLALDEFAETLSGKIVEIKRAA